MYSVGCLEPKESKNAVSYNGKNLENTKLERSSREAHRQDKSKISVTY